MLGMKVDNGAKLNRKLRQTEEEAAAQEAETK